MVAGGAGISRGQSHTDGEILGKFGNREWWGMHITFKAPIEKQSCKYKYGPYFKESEMLGWAVIPYFQKIFFFSEGAGGILVLTLHSERYSGNSNVADEAETERPGAGRLIRRLQLWTRKRWWSWTEKGRAKGSGAWDIAKVTSGYSKSPTYKPSSFELPKTQSHLPSTSSLSEIVACPQSPTADELSLLPSPTSSPFSSQ